MKKLLYLFLCLVLSCISFDFSIYNVRGKATQDHILAKRSKENLILRPFKMAGLLWGCTSGDVPDRGGHQSHQSHNSHGSHYSSH